MTHAEIDSAAPASPAAAGTGYPLSALVGQEDLVEALLVCAVNPAVGGVLVRGERGTAKSTAVRALAPMLGEGAPLIDVPLGATLDRLVGSLDVRAALGGEHRIDRGLLARADGGVLYVDEVNLLGDHLVDALLDAAAAGRVIVERDGISVTAPARFLLVGTMNPEEGELRPQLLDRFGLGVEVAGSRDPRVRAEIVRRRMAFDADPGAFRAQWAESEADVARRLADARRRLPDVRLSSQMLERITTVCARLELDGVRGDLVCAQAARALAALDGSAEVEAAHVARAAHLALRHRMRRDPLAPPPPPGGGEPAIDEALDAAEATADPNAVRDAPERSENDTTSGAADPYHADVPIQTSAAGGESGRQDGGRATGAGTTDGVGPEGRGRRDSGAASSSPSASARPVAVPSRIPADALALGRRAAQGRRAQARAGAPAPAGRARGGDLAVVDARPARSDDEPVAALPTLLAALRGEHAPMTAIRGGGRSAHVVLVVDASGSMAAQRRLARVKGAVEAALRTAYARRDRVTVIAFAGAGATTLVAPGTPLEQAAAAVAELPAGGRTPLAEGLEHAAAVLDGRARAGALPADGRARLVLLLTDGRAADPEGRAARALGRIARTADRTVVVDLEEGRVRLGLAAELAARAGADLTRLVTPGAPTQPPHMTPGGGVSQRLGVIHEPRGRAA